MDANAILSKSRKGQEEIETRQNKLNSRIRSILIIVDGKTTIGELIAKFNHIDSVEEDIRNLIKYRFVRVQKDFKKQRRALSKILTDTLGPHADFFTLQLEDCENISDLEEFTKSKREMLERSLGARGKPFWDKLKEITG